MDNNSPRQNQTNSFDYFSFFDSSEDTILVVDKKFCLIYGNKLFQKNIYALTGKEIEIGDSVFNDKVPEDYIKLWRGYIERAFNGETFHIEIETQLILKNEIIDYLFNPTKNSSGVVQAAVISGRKITNQKRLEYDLRRSEVFLNRAETVAGFGSWEFDLNAGTVYASEGAKIIYGLKNRKWLISEVQNITLKEYRDSLDQALVDLVDNGKPYDIEFRIYRSTDNKILDIHSVAGYDSNRNVVFGVIHDITEQKRISSEVIKTGVLFKQVWDCSNDGMRLTDSEGKIIKVNRAFCDMVGKTKEELENGFLSEIYDPSFGYIILNAYRKKFKEGKITTNLENKFTLWNGKKLWFSVSISVLETDSPTPIVLSIFRNITEQKNDMEKLKNREAQISSIFNAAPVGIGMGLNHIITEVNDAFLQITGYDREEVIGKTSRMFYSEDKDYKFESNEIIRQLKEQEIGHIEVNWKRKDDRQIPVIFSFSAMNAADLTKGISITVLDITDRKKHEAELKYNGKVLSAIAKATKELLITEDVYDAIHKSLVILGEAAEVDRAYLFENNFKNGKPLHTFSQKLEWVSVGIEPQTDNPQLQDVSFADKDDFIGPLSRGKIFNYILRELPESITKQVLSSQNILSILVLPVFVKNKFFGFVGFDECKYERIWSETDISLLGAFADSVAKTIERNMVQNELEQTLKQLKETQKQVLIQERLRSLGQMTSGICHDINNSLTPIMGYIDIMRDDEELVKHYEKPFNMIIKSTEDIANTIGRLKEFYKLKLSPDELSFVDVNKLIHDAVELTRHRWKNIPESTGTIIEVIENYDNNLPKVKVDESELREAVINIILNACDAMPKGGKLCFTTNIWEGKVRIKAQDFGVGMNEDVLYHCIDPFFSTKGEKGTGLGLAMVFGIVERHKGELKIDSKIGFGTVVQITLPLDRELEEDIVLEKTTKVIRPLNILYVEDDVVIAEMIKRILEKRNHRVTWSSNGKIGLKVFQDNLTSKKPFDLIITDLGMIEMDGISLSQQTKSIAPNIPVILFTGWGTIVNKDEIPSVDRLLKKPIMKEDLFNTISSLFP